MKKIVALLLTFVMALSLCSCTPAQIKHWLGRDKGFKDTEISLGDAFVDLNK